MLPLNILVVSLFALLLSTASNFAAIYVVHRHTWACESGRSVDDGRFSMLLLPTIRWTLFTIVFKGYIGDDHPYQLPLRVPSVALRVEDSDRYGLSYFYAWGDWRSTDTFPHGNGFVKLGPDGEVHRG